MVDIEFVIKIGKSRLTQMLRLSSMCVSYTKIQLFRFSSFKQLMKLYMYYELLICTILTVVAVHSVESVIYLRQFFLWIRTQQVLDSVSLFKLEFQELALSCCWAGHGMDQISNHTSFSSTQRNGTFYHSCNKTILGLFINFQFSIDTVLAWGHFKLSRIVNPVWKLFGPLSQSKPLH